MEKTGFTYLWYDKKRKMYYIGCHWGTVDDGYICSSNRMRDAYRRRPEDFKRRILKKDIFRENLLAEEFKWLQLIPKDQLGTKYYNLSKQHFGHWSDNSETRFSIGEKISRANLGKKKHSEESKQKIREARLGIKIGPRGPMSEEHKQKIREARLGIQCSEEHKQKISKARLGMKFSEEHKQNIREASLKRIREI